MKLLRCALCDGEADIIGNYKSVFKKVKCRKCNYTNSNTKEKPMPEVVIIKKKNLSE